MIKLSEQANKILDILSDFGWHCPIDWSYSDGHGKRLTDINRYLASLGKKLAWGWCDCGRHISRVKMRRIVESSVAQNLAPRSLETPSVVLSTHENQLNLYDS